VSVILPIISKGVNRNYEKGRRDDRARSFLEGEENKGIFLRICFIIMRALPAEKLYARRRKIQTIAVCKTDVRDFANLPESSDLGDSEIEESLGLQHCLRKKLLKDGIHLRILIASNFASPVLNEKCLRLKNVRCNNYAGRG